MPKFEAINGKPLIDGQEVLKGWESFTGWYWFAVEESYKQDSVIDGKVFENDQIYFGYVQGQFDEWGYFSKAELGINSLVWEIKKEDLAYAGRRY